MTSTDVAVTDRGSFLRRTALLAACVLVVTACGTDGESGMPVEGVAAESPVLSQETDAARPDEQQSPAAGEPAPAPAPAPAITEVKVEVWPIPHRQQIPGPVGYWWGPSAFAEVAQSLLVPEAFELEEIRFGVIRTSGLAGWQTRSMMDEELQWRHDVAWSGTVPDAVIRVTIWPLDGPGEAQLDMAGVAPLTEQMATTDIPVSGYNGSQFARLRLEAPVALEAGYYLVSLGIDSFGDPDTFNTYIWGRNFGHTDQLGFDHDGGPLECEYPPILDENDYPHGRAYYRVLGRHSHPVLLENLTTVFREHRAKVLSEALNDCKFDPMLPGDLELTLVGRD